MNYQIIKNEEKLRSFIDWLPELGPNEKYYCCLFSRKKYSDEDIQASDKTQLKRFLSSKERLFEKIKQLEVEEGSYRLKKIGAPQESLALYINPNPRDLKKASFEGIIELTRSLQNNNENLNPHATLMSCIPAYLGEKALFGFRHRYQRF